MVATFLQNVFHAIVVSSLFAQSMLPLDYPVPQFGVSFPDKLLKIVCYQMRDF